MTTQEKIIELAEKKQKLMGCGGPKAVDRQHSQGKWTARERIDVLLDPGTFREIDQLVEHRCTSFDMGGKEIPADAVVCGYGKIDGRTVYVFSQDFTVLGGSLGEMHAKKICKVMDMAMQNSAPVIGINDSGGARIQEGIDALSGYGQIFYRNSTCSGHIPQISVIMGPCAGGAVYSPALTDFILMVEEKSQMFITGPAVIKATTGEEITQEALGGAKTHSTISGVSHLSASSEEECLGYVRKILSYLPSSNREKPPVLPAPQGDDGLRPVLDTIIPDRAKQPYDVKHVIEQLVDAGSFFELQPGFARNLVIGFGRMGGQSVGIVANQPYCLAGCIDINASVKSARFIQMCSTFNVPLLNLVDVPGFLPGSDQEHQGIIRHGAKMLYAYSVAEVPKITVVMRKAYGGSYLAMCSKDLGADFVYAWPTAEIAVMGAEGAANIVFRKEISAAADPIAAWKENIEKYSAQFETPYEAAKRGFVDMVIRPAETRQRVLEALVVLSNKMRPEHGRGNMPL